jgi:ribose 5-phosphate isomerase B
MIFIANDHGGVELKNAIVKLLGERGEKVVDLGTGTEDSVDYPDFAFACAERVAATDGALGIVICKSGVGVSICANKVKGVRCALCTAEINAKLCRNHNNANMLALGAGNTDERTALAIVEAFLSAEFEGGRHCRRVDKISEYEDAHAK